MRKVKTTLHTDGCGYWTDLAKAVNIVGMSMPYVNDQDDFGELCIYFDKGWDVEVDGLIYTDAQFLQELKAYLNSIGLEGDDVEYSEQGMQGDDYVSLDVGEHFIKSYDSVFA